MAMTIYASFADAANAEKAAGALLDFGVRPEDLTLVQSEARRTMTTADAVSSDVVEKETVTEAGGYNTMEVSRTSDDVKNTEKAAKHGISTTTAADAGSGAITGTAVGLGVGALAALASLFIPGVGIVTGAGALATALTGAAATTGAGAAVGAVTGYLKDQGVEEYVATRYGEAVDRGGALLTVHVPSGDLDEPRARQLLDKYGAVDVNSYATVGTKPYMA